jgi:hypothetical protein
MYTIFPYGIVKGTIREMKQKMGKNMGEGISRGMKRVNSIGDELYEQSTRRLSESRRESMFVLVYALIEMIEEHCLRFLVRAKMANAQKCEN